MANYNWLTGGVDFTAIVGVPPNSAFTQGFQEAKPSATTGWVVYSATAPDVVTYPDLVRAIWGKTAAGVITGYFYWWDGSDWQPWTIETGTLLGSSFANYSIDITKLSLFGSSPNYVLAVNGAGDGLYWDSPLNLIVDGTVNIAKLIPAVEGAGMALVSGAAGVWQRVNLDTRIFTVIEDTLIEATHIADLVGGGQLGQVLTLDAPDGTAYWDWPDQLLRNNTVPTNKLQLDIANAGKVPVVNVTGTDYDYISAATGSVAVLYFGGAQGTAPQQITTGAVRTVNWTGKQSDLANLITLTSNQWTFAKTGNYLVRVTVPVHSTGNNTVGCILLRSITTPAELDAASFYVTLDNGYGSVACLETVVTVVSTTEVYEVSIDASSTVNLYSSSALTPPNRNSHVERYQRMSITKLS